MHEYSIVQSLVDSVAAAVPANAIVHRVDIAIGDLAGVDCGLLATAYEVFREGTLCERAALSIDRIPARWQCPQCSAEVSLRCTRCEQPARLAAGDEIVLKRVELEVA